MKSVILFLFLALPTSLLIATPRAKPTEKSIVPARSIGDIQLGELLTEVEARYRESPKADASMGVVTEPWDVSGGILEVKAKRPDEHTFVVTCVRTTSARYRTAGGLCVGSKLSEVRVRYPHGEFPSSKSSSFEGANETWIYGDSGIDFEFASRKDSSRCIAIRVWNP